MLMVIFGAGASFDSYATQPAKDWPAVTWRPPLARELFSRAELYGDIDKFPECQPIVPRLYALPSGISLEEELERLQHEADGGDPERDRQLVAVRYYLQYVIAHSQRGWREHTRGVSNYKTLLDQIRRWKKEQPDPVCLVTFNYDSLLETAHDELPWTPGISGSVRNFITTEYKIFKLHGSVTWGREIDTGIPEVIQPVAGDRQWETVRAVIKRAAELDVTNRYVVANKFPIYTVDRKVALFPAIAIPVQRKQKYECPEDHVRLLDELLPKVDCVVIIGWRGREEQFVGKLVGALPKDTRTVVVSGNPESAAEVKGFLQASGYPGAIATAADGFSGFVLKEQLEKFLSWTGDDQLQLD